jgi:RNA polymerase sigma-70 factor (sigma-E family)
VLQQWGRGEATDRRRSDRCSGQVPRDSAAWRAGQQRERSAGGVKNCHLSVATFSARDVVGAPWRRIVSDFEEYVAAAWPRLLRSAWVLTGDWHRAEDLVQTVLARVYGRWSRVRDDAQDAYLRSMLVTTYLSWWRRKWRGELAFEVLPERPAADQHAGSDLRMALAEVLAGLPRQQRAVLMLRFHADMTETDTAAVKDISVGTVKSYTARALAALRANPALHAILTDTEGASG